MIKGIKFVNVPVSDQDKAVRFYTEKLGFRVLTDQPFNEKQRWIALGLPGADTGLVLFNTDDDAGRVGARQPISFWCDDVMATAKVLKDKGVAFTLEPKKEEWGSVSIFKDQDGNQFVLSSR